MSENSLMKGYQYVDALKLKNNLYHTKSRGARMYTDHNPRCDAYRCHGIETLGHILQSCRLTHGVRLKRHDWVLDLLPSELSKRWEVKVEPHFSDVDATYTLDLAISRDCFCVVMDVGITSDNASQDDVHKIKASKYNNLQVKKQAREITGAATVEVSACIFNWRGTPNPLTVKTLTEIGLTKSKIELLSIRTLEGGASILRIGRNSNK